MTPPMRCGRCGNEYFVQQDSIQCECGQWLYRVLIGRDGRPVAPVGMPEQIRQQMERAWDQGLASRLGTFKPLPVDYEAQMAEWAERHGVTPLEPRQVTRDASAAFGRQSEDASRAEFYASWSAYDAALEAMPRRQQFLQRRAEVLELERMLAL